MSVAILFDLDGVLVDSEAISTKASDSVLKKHGIVQTEKEREKVFGRRTYDNYKDAIDARGLDIDPQILVDEKIKLFNEMIVGQLKPLDGVLDFLESLKENEIKMAVVSSSPLKRVEASLAEAGLFEYFKIIVSGDCCKLGKPNPEPFLYGASLLDVDAGDCVVIEDAQAGVEAAVAAKMKVIAIESPNTFGQDLSNATKIVKSITEISIDMINGL